MLYRFQHQSHEGDIKAPQQRENLDEVFGDAESCGSFSSDSEEEQKKRSDLKDFTVKMDLKFDSKNKYIDKMIETMKLNNRDPYDRKLYKV